MHAFCVHRVSDSYGRPRLPYDVRLTFLHLRLFRSQYYEANGVTLHYNQVNRVTKGLRDQGSFAKVIAPQHDEALGGGSDYCCPAGFVWLRCSTAATILALASLGMSGNARGEWLHSSKK